MKDNRHMIDLDFITEFCVKYFKEKKKGTFSDLEARGWRHEDMKLKEETTIKKGGPKH